VHSSGEPGELLQWQCHDDSVVNIVVTITVTVLLCRSGGDEQLEDIASHRRQIADVKTSGYAVNTVQATPSALPTAAVSTSHEPVNQDLVQQLQRTVRSEMRRIVEVNNS